MDEIPLKRVGISTGVQAGAVLGLYVGFSVAVVSALTRPDDLFRHLKLFCLFPIVFAFTLGPVLGFRKIPDIPYVNPLHEARVLLEEYNEGQGNWRSVSHVQSDGRMLRIDLNNLLNIRGVVKTSLKLSNKHPIRFIVGRGSKSSRNPDLRNHVLGYIEKDIPSTRIKRTTSSIEVMPPTVHSQVEKSNKIEKIVLFSLPIVIFLAWLELQ